MLLCLGPFMVYMDATVVSVALPSIQNSLRTDVAGLQWIVDGYTLAFASLLLTAGALGDLIGRRRVFLYGLGGFTACSVLCAVAPSTGLLIAFRVLQGAFGSVTIPLSLALLVEVYAGRDRARAVGVWSGMGGVSLALGPVVGGLLVEYFGWQSIFWINMPIGIATIVLTARALSPGTGTVDVAPPARRHLDLPGQGLLVITLATLTAACIEGTASGWRAPLVLMLSAVAVGALVAFVAWERSSPHPLIPLSYFRLRNFSLPSAVGFMSFFCLRGVIFFFTLFLQDVSLFSPVEAGLCFLPLTVAIFVAAPAVGLVVGRFGVRTPMVVGTVMMAAGLAALATLDADRGYGGVWWALMLLGAGISVANTPGTIAVVTSVPPQRAGTASAVVNTARQVGGMFGVAVLGALGLHRLEASIPQMSRSLPMDDAMRSRVEAVLGGGDLSGLRSLPHQVQSAIGDQIAAPFVHDFRMAMIVGTCVAVAATLCAALLRRTTSR